jgi:hypothetical protein
MGGGADIGEADEHGIKNPKLGSHWLAEIMPICCMAAKTPKCNLTQVEADRSLHILISFV